MLRLLGATLVVVTAAALVTGDARSLSTKEFLEHEAMTLLPSDARLLDGRYESNCYAFLLPESPPCLWVRFRLPGPVATRKAALVDIAGSRWAVRVRDHANGSDVRFTRGELRAHAEVLNTDYRRRCHSYLTIGPLTCEDSLRVEVGPPPIFPRFDVRDLEDVLRRERERHPLKR